MTRPLVVMTLLLAGCPLEEKDSDTGDSAAPDGCDAGEGTLTGLATVDGAASAEVQVSAWPEDGGDPVSVDPSDGDGRYAVCLPAGRWYVSAEAYGCETGDRADVVEGESTSLDLDVDSVMDCETADKPNLYLYPSAPTRTAVTIGLSQGQRVFASDPPYRKGWRGVALPDGRFVTAEGPAPFLFYEVTLPRGMSSSFQRDAGWCLDGDVPAAVHAMAGVLEAYGFNAGEVDDFVEGWRVDLPPAGAYAVYPQREVDHAAGLTVTPSLPIERLWLLVEETGACDGALPEPAIVPFDRAGAHGVEWGVVLRGMVR